MQEASSDATTADLNPTKIRWEAWWIAIIAALSVAWPLALAALLHGPKVLIRALTGDSYHYLEIARNAVSSHLYTYDGVHVTNGFHPLWQYSIRALFSFFQIEGHESQAIAMMLLALVSGTLGVALASAGVVRITQRKFLGLMMVPGLFYLAIGVHTDTQSIWAAFNGMESAFSVLFGGVLFFVLSFHYGLAARRPFDVVRAYRALGWVLPFLVLSRLDDVFILPAMIVAALAFSRSFPEWVKASFWVAAPTTVVVLGYMAYNHMTAGSAMPLSGSTKAGFAGAVSTYLAAAIHFPPLLELKGWLTGSPSDGDVVHLNAFRFVEMVYPMLLASIGAVALWKYRKGARRELMVPFGLCLYILIKVGYNFFFVHPWHQSDWYYAFIMLTISVLGALVLARPWGMLDCQAVARRGIVLVYVGVMLLSGAHFHSVLAYQGPGLSQQMDDFWERAPAIRHQLRQRGATGLINVDDGISAFLLDLPAMHGFAFATDQEAQQAFREGRMLTLAQARGINAIVGFGYLGMDRPIVHPDELREYLRGGLAEPLMRAEIDQFEFSLLYHDSQLDLPIISFRSKP